ncbi:MAG TPA: methyltransferase domain-containing protein [Burkholderiales bacterium]|nr:methyltransferase domain-containing protein [Burkholderiales bacterium]
MQPQHELTAPSEWVSRFASLIPEKGKVLDVACGSGRHARLLAGLGHIVEAVDGDESSLQSLRGVAGVSARLADLEGGPWPYTGRQFAGIIVCNYLHRPLFPRMLEALEQEGVLIYETFAVGNERFGKPSNPNFLLKPGELLEVVRGQLRVIAYEDVYVDHPKPAMVQRICAKRENG